MIGCKDYCLAELFPKGTVPKYIIKRSQKLAQKRKRDTSSIGFGAGSRLLWETVLLMVVLLPFLPFVEAAPLVSAQELLENAQEYDGKTVVYQGEMIGDIMVRGEFAWINVRDETASIGVFSPKELVGEIKRQGGYGVSGDIISVQGVFHHSCLEHGGDTDIHAEKITIVQKGKTLAYPLEPRKVKAGIILSAIAFALAILHLAIRRFR